MRKILCAAGLFLAACSTSPSVSADVAATEQALTVAEQSATFYAKLPRCGAGATICSNQATVDKLKALDNQAYQAVVAARSNSALISAAWAAISSLSSAIPTTVSK